MDGTSVPRRVRVFVYAFLGILVVAGIAPLEQWPLTGYRLYDDLRRPTHPTWELETVSFDDVEHEVSLYDLPIAYRNTDRHLGREGDPDFLRAAVVCRAWATAFRERDDEVKALRIYRTRVVARTGEKLSRRLVQACLPEAS